MDGHVTVLPPPLYPTAVSAADSAADSAEHRCTSFRVTINWPTARRVRTGSRPRAPALSPSKVHPCSLLSVHPRKGCCLKRRPTLQRVCWTPHRSQRGCPRSCACGDSFVVVVDFMASGGVVVLLRASHVARERVVGSYSTEFFRVHRALV